MMCSTFSTYLKKLIVRNLGDVKRRYLKDGALSLFNTYVRFAINVKLINNTLRYVHNYKKPVFAFVTNTKFKLSKKYKTQKQLLEKK